MLLAAFHRGALTAGSVEVSIEEAVDRAEQHSALVASGRLREERALSAVSEASSFRQPKVDLSASYSRLSEVPELVITGPDFELRSIFPNIPDRYGARLSFSVPLYAGGGIEAGVDAASEVATAAESETETTRADVRLEAMQAWWALVTAREAERVLLEAMASFDRHLVDAQNREELGLAARNELLAVRVERDRAELGWLRATFAAERAQANLARLCGLEGWTRIEPDPIPEPRVDLPDSAEVMVQQALALRTERQTLASRRDAELARARIERAPSRPSLTLDGGYDYSNPNLRVLPLEEAWKDTWDVSVRFRWTLWDGNRASQAEAGSIAEARAISERLTDLDRRIRLEVISRYLDVQEAARALPVAERAVQAAAESERIARDRYREGLLPSAELLDAEAARLQAGLDRTEALARLAVARALLERAVGAALP
jgi:outer membrane protein TolC